MLASPSFPGRRRSERDLARYFDANETHASAALALLDLPLAALRLITVFTCADHEVLPRPSGDLRSLGLILRRTSRRRKQSNAAKFSSDTAERRVAARRYRRPAYANNRAAPSRRRPVCANRRLLDASSRSGRGFPRPRPVV